MIRNCLSQHYIGRLCETLRKHIKAYQEVIEEHPRSTWINKAREGMNRIGVREEGESSLLFSWG